MSEFIPFAVVPNTASEFKRRAEKEYPYLKEKDVNVAYNPDRKLGYLEFYPPGETGSPEFPRPEQFPMNESGIDVRSPKTTSKDILGDYVSHYGIYSDPVLIENYQQVEESLTDKQKDFLKRQYNDYQRGYYVDENNTKVSLGEPESRPYEDWLKMSGLPGLYRGNLFNQWQNSEDFYTEEQLDLFKKAKEYLNIND